MIAYPQVLPVFPLTGVLLLPGAYVPLHVFEQRYLHMVEDVLGERGFIGLIQPFAPCQDSRPSADEASSQQAPELYSVGCVGAIDYSEKLPNERYIVLVRGIHRFRVGRELPLLRGYRRAEVHYDEFSVDASDVDAEVEPERLITALRSFGQMHQVPLDVNKLAELPGRSLLNSMAMALPFLPAEKQALLEASNVYERQELLLTLMSMGFDIDSYELQSPPVIH